jgi:predicted ArsR family transcriptional regulator
MTPVEQTLISKMRANQSRIGSCVWELLVLLNGGPQVAVGQMAERLGRNRRTVARHLGRLKKRGVIERRAVPGKANSYAFRLNEEGK